MAIVVGQTTVTGSSAPFVSVPPGVNTLIVSNTSGATVYIGPGTVTATNGFAIPNGAPPVSIPGFNASKPTQLSVIGTSGNISWILSTAA